MVDLFQAEYNSALHFVPSPSHLNLFHRPLSPSLSPSACPVKFTSEGMPVAEVMRSYFTGSLRPSCHPIPKSPSHPVTQFPFFKLCQVSPPCLPARRPWQVLLLPTTYCLLVPAPHCLQHNKEMQKHC